MDADKIKEGGQDTDININIKQASFATQKICLAG